MFGSSRPSRAGQMVTGRGFARAVAVTFTLMLAIAAGSQPVLAATTPTPTPTASPTPARTPTPSPSPTPTAINSDLSAGAALTNLGSNFLERLGNQATNGFGGALRSNPAGGGASESTDA